MVGPEVPGPLLRIDTTSSEPRQVILTALASSDGWVSGHALSEKMGISRTAIWKHINVLKEEGYTIDSVRNKGYLLMPEPDLLLPGYIAHGLGTEFLAKKIYYSSTIDSTNRTMKRMAVEGEPHGSLLVAGEQGSGRGRLERSWHSPPGGLWMSLLLRPDLHPNQAGRLLLAVGVSMAQAVRDVTGLEVALKWPNDLLFNGKKVCGILTEIGAEMDRLNWLVVGIGANVNNPLSSLPDDVQDRATTLVHENEQPIDRSALVCKFLGHLEPLYCGLLDGDHGSLIRQWKELSDTLGQQVEISAFGSKLIGIARDIDEWGALVIEKEDGSMSKVMTGDCQHLRRHS